MTCQSAFQRLALSASCIAACWAQFPPGTGIGVFPTRVNITVPADTLIPLRIWGSLGISSSPKGGFKLLSYTPGFEGDPHFLIVSPSSGTAPISSLLAAPIAYALDPTVVPYLQSGILHEAFLMFGFTDPALSVFKTGVRISLYVQFEYPTISSVVSSAASLPVIAPGQVVSIYGTHLSTPPIVAQPGADGLYPTALGNSVVTFNGIPASILYVSNNQINCIVPSRVGRDSTAQVVVARVRGGNTVTPTPAFTIPVQGTSPEIFTVNPNGKGPVAAYNIDSAGGAIATNDAANPAPVGSGISFLSSGAGLWDTSMFNDPIDDAAVPLISMPPKAPVSVTIGGQTAKVTYARSADGKIGILQVNAIVPEGVSAGEQPIVLKIGQNDNSSQNATIFVK